MSSIPRPEDVKLIMTDVDGTFITDDHTLHPRTRDAVQYIRTHHPDIPIIVATGKHRYACEWFIQELDLDHYPAASCHGAIIHGPRGVIVSSQTLMPSTALAIVEAARKLDRTCFFFTLDQVVLLHTEKHPKKDWIGIVKKIESNLIDGQDEEFLNRVRNGQVKVIKATIPAEPSVMVELQDQFREILINSHPQLTMTTALPFVLEIVQIGINKSIALNAFCDQFDCQPHQVLAFGDGMNDLEMISAAGYGVAMSNADEKLISVAKFQTTSNNEGGVGVFLDQIFRPS